MKKYIAVLLFALTFVCSASRNVYAADEYTYSEYVDEVCGMEQPYWSFDYYPELEYAHKFLIFEWGQAETIAWNIDTVSYYFTLNNEHVGEFLVGYNASDMDITFDYVYSSVDDSMQKYTSTASFVYSLVDVEFDNGYVEFVFPYEEVLAGCEYYDEGYDTVLDSVRICISSRITGKVGTVAYYEFECDEEYSKQMYTGINYYNITDTEKVLVSDKAGVFKSDNDGTGDGNGGNVEKHSYVVIYPDSLQESAFILSDIMTMIMIDFPRAVWNVIVFLFEFVLMLPELVHMVIPFLPETIIAAFMFVVAFGVVWGIVAWIRKLKGD